MYIEVTKQTFFKVFNSFNKTKNKNTEKAYIEKYYNPKLEQSGKTIYNYVNSIHQYYLEDINA